MVTEIPVYYICPRTRRSFTGTLLADPKSPDWLIRVGKDAADASKRGMAAAPSTATYWARGYGVPSQNGWKAWRVARDIPDRDIRRGDRIEAVRRAFRFEPEKRNRLPQMPYPSEETEENATTTQFLPPSDTDDSLASSQVEKMNVNLERISQALERMSTRLDDLVGLLVGLAEKRKRDS